MVGYFDWFSGYQETALAEAFAKVADTEVVASDRVSPAFSDEHLDRLGLPRRYEPGSQRENGIRVTRFRCWERRSMVWSSEVHRYVRSRPCDLIVQVMPGQLLPVGPSLVPHQAVRVALYGDQRAMWAELSAVARVLKGIVFALTKGLLYAVVNSRAKRVFGYTPNTLRRLRALAPGRRMELMPLAFSAERFYFDPDLRQRVRRSLGCSEDTVLVLAAGKVERRKRLDWLIQAFEAVAEGSSRLRLLVLGADRSEDSQALRQMAEISPARDRIDIQGFANPADLNAAFNASDVAVWPRNPAITIQQAMGTGLFVALPRNDLVGHLIKDGTDSGCYFEPLPGDDVTALSTVLSTAAVTIDFSAESRLRRVEQNSWLSAESVVADLLAAAARTC